MFSVSTDKNDLNDPIMSSVTVTCMFNDEWVMSRAEKRQLPQIWRTWDDWMKVFHSRECWQNMVPAMALALRDEVG